MYTRNCPRCNGICIHKTEFSRDRQHRLLALCRKCSSQDHSIRMLGDTNKQRGKPNPIFAKIQRERKRIPLSIEKRIELSKKIKQLNPKQNKNNYEIWLEKYGQEEANKRQAAYIQKQLNNCKPSFIGKGWSGKYKDIRFLSLKELSYMLYLDNNKIDWKICDLRIKWVDEAGKDRIYIPDFIIGKTIIEIKPKNLHNNKVVIAKFAALKKWCALNDNNCEIIDVKVNDEAIINAYQQGLIWLHPISKEKFLTYYRLKGKI